MGKKKRILTWHGYFNGRKGGRWKKQILGKVHFFGTGESPDDLKAYRVAEKAYFDFMQRLETTTPVEVKVSKATVEDIIEKFLQLLEQRWKRGEVCAAYFDRTRTSLRKFIDWIGEDTPFNSIREIKLEDYRSFVLDRPVSKRIKRKISRSTVKEYLGALKTLYRWAYKTYLCEHLPRNMIDFTKMPSAGEPEIAAFTMDEIRELWATSPERLRCWIALALNCGFGAKDIADLKVGEIDWAGGYIERERSKTKIKAKFKLWTVTLDLLKKEKPADAIAEERFFLTEKGSPLVHNEIVDGVLKRNDAVKCSFWRIQQATGINGGRGFYSFRKAGATLIEVIDPAATEMYLSHSEKGMKKHYAQRDWGRLERATLVMAEKLKDVLVTQGDGATDSTGAAAMAFCGDGI